MRVASLLTFVVLTSATPSSQAPELILAPYLSPKYVASANVPSSIIVATAPGYRPRMFDLWLADDPLIAERRKAGLPVPGAPDQVAVRAVTRDAADVWHATRDLPMLRE